MGIANLAERVAVCTWSLQPTNPAELLDKVRATGIQKVQIALDPLREEPATWGGVPELFKANDISIVSGMLGCVGEDYSTLETIRRTGGVAPDATWDQNLANAKATADLAARLALKLVTFHAGFLPHDQSDPVFTRMIDRLRAVADVFAQRGILLGFETGQESAAALAEVLKTLGRPNVVVNFDPANMVLYDKGDPVPAVETLFPWVKQVHIKDAKRTKVPGTWGEEVAVGTGDVDWAAFMGILVRRGFEGNLVIEREAGTERVADIRTAHQLLKSFI